MAIYTFYFNYLDISEERVHLFYNYYDNKTRVKVRKLGIYFSLFYELFYYHNPINKTIETYTV